MGSLEADEGREEFGSKGGGFVVGRAYSCRGKGVAMGVEVDLEVFNVFPLHTEGEGAGEGEGGGGGSPCSKGRGERGNASEGALYVLKGGGGCIEGAQEVQDGEYLGGGEGDRAGGSTGEAGGLSAYTTSQPSGG